MLFLVKGGAKKTWGGGGGICTSAASQIPRYKFKSKRPDKSTTSYDILDFKN